MNKFVIGIGSQRAGSTLLHQILSTSKSIFMHPLKELHYFDTKYNVRGLKTLKDFSLQQLNRELKLSFTKNSIDDKRRKCYIEANRILAFEAINNVNYIDLYRPCVMHNKILGEVTPEYMLLPDEGVNDLRNNIGNDSLVILICRNPIRRFISAIKLTKTYNKLNIDDEVMQNRIIQSLNNNDGWATTQDGFNDYKSAIEIYRKNFNNLLVINYDDFFNNPLNIFNRLNDYSLLDLQEDLFLSTLSKKYNKLGDNNFHLNKNFESILSDRYKESQIFLNDYFSSNVLI